MQALSEPVSTNCDTLNFQSQILQKLYFVLNQYFTGKKPETRNGRRPDCPQKAMLVSTPLGRARESFSKGFQFCEEIPVGKSTMADFMRRPRPEFGGHPDSTKNVDFSGAAATIPAKSGTALPATCNAGEMFFKTNNSPGQNLYTCEPANTWTQVAGSTNGTVSSATSGQFGFYAGSGNVIIGHSLSASDIPALNYQTPLTFTGSGTKTATSTGTLLTNDCAKWDASGNIIDSGTPCASIATGSVGQFGFYSASGNALTPYPDGQ